MATTLATNTGGAQDKKITTNPAQGDAQLPVQPQPVAQPASTSSYTPINATAAPGVNLEAYDDQVALQQEWLASNPNVLNQNINDIRNQYADVVSQTAGTGWNSNSGGLTQNAGIVQSALNSGATVTPTTYSGQEGWYQVDGVERTTQAGTSGADEDLMSDADYAIIQQLKANWTEYDTLYKTYLAQGDTEKANHYLSLRDEAHAQAERIRAGYGYMGGSDGSQYLTLGALGVSLPSSSGTDYSTNYGGVTTGTSANGNREFLGNEIPDLKSLLEEWKEAAAAQSNGKIDYGVSQAITELERALADAEPQFKEQMEAIYRDEMQALDNSALYAELRGDKGGIGQSQYNEIQAAAAQNRLAVQQAQTKLATDTARQIADLRAQGEFQKADQALEISQQYLSQLIGLEQWSAEFGLSVDQFQESIRQWEAEYNLAMQQFQVNTDLAYKQYATDTDLAYAQLTGQLSDGTLTLSGQNQMAALGWELLNAGVMPNAEQLAAMGLNAAQAQEMLVAAQIAAASKGSATTTSSVGNNGKISATSTPSEVYQYLYNKRYTDVEIAESAIKAELISLGFSATAAGSYAKAYVDSKYSEMRRADIQSQQGEDNTVTVPEFGRIDYEYAMKLVDAGYLTITGLDKNGEPVFARTNKKFMPDVPVAKG